jgi:hypothetical protein
VPFVLFVPPALTLHHFVCPEHPQIEAALLDLYNGPTHRGPRRLALLLFDDAHAYVRSFLYAASYPIRFLPGVDAANGVIKATNMLVIIVIIVVGALALCIPVLALFRCWKSCRFHPGSIAADLFEKNQPFVVAVLIAIPAVFLFVYDISQSFYRYIYLNHLTSIAACLILAPLSGRIAVRATKGACAIIGIAVGASLILNAFVFVPQLRDGYEGPSLSVFRSWPQVSRDTENLARLCKMDLQRGRIIVDDLTQAGVFSRPVTIPVTWLGQQAVFIGMSVHDAAISVKANYAILRCHNFDLLGIKPQGKTGEICCYAFN